MVYKPFLKGAWLRHVTHFKFWGPTYISGMAEATANKFCTLVCHGITNCTSNGHDHGHVTSLNFWK